MIRRPDRPRRQRTSRPAPGPSRSGPSSAMLPTRRITASSRAEAARSGRRRGRCDRRCVGAALSTRRSFGGVDATKPPLTRPVASGMRWDDPGSALGLEARIRERGQPSGRPRTRIRDGGDTPLSPPSRLGRAVLTPFGRRGGQALCRKVHSAPHRHTPPSPTRRQVRLPAASVSGLRSGREPAGQHAAEAVDLVLGVVVVHRGAHDGVEAAPAEIERRHSAPARPRR